MQEVTLALAILLCTGFFIAKIGQLLRLPSVTGYICAGILLGPSGFAVVTDEAIGQQLDHFTQIALMLIAFGIGEHLEIRRLRHNVRSISIISISETLSTFCLVAFGIALLANLAGSDTTGLRYCIILALLAAALSLDTAPATTLHVMREIGAAGPMTTLLLQIVALNNGIAIIVFGIAVSVTHQMLGAGNVSLLFSLITSLTEIASSLLIGIFTGLFIDFIIHRLSRRGEMLTIGISLLLLAGELARYLHFSPLLVGISAGFTIVNRDHRDVRLFRVINAFEPPIYVLFFTLAGAHLDIAMLRIAGWFGITFFALRAIGKVGGASLGAHIAGEKAPLRSNIGFTLIPQAGIAIGLVFLLRSESALRSYSELLTPIILTGVFLAELVGPVIAHRAVNRAGEAAPADAGKKRNNGLPFSEVAIVPWTWGKLLPETSPQGTVLFGASHPRTASGLARFTILLAHHLKARALSVRVVEPRSQAAGKNGTELFKAELQEADTMGYDLGTAVIHAENITEALLATAGQASAKAIILGHPEKGSQQDFQRIIEKVAGGASCQVIVIRLAGLLHTERILIPIAGTEELYTVEDALKALSKIGRHRITLLWMLSSDATETECSRTKKWLAEWALTNELGPYVLCRAVPVESRLEIILEWSAKHDLLLMAASPHAHGIQRVFFGSLASDVAQRCRKPLIMVHAPRKPAAKK